MSYRFSRLSLAIPFATAAILAACSSSTSSNNPKPTANVVITTGAAAKTVTAYAPDTFTVTLASGGRVIFRNDDNGVFHTATGDADSASFYTGSLQSGSVDTITFTTAGNHPFHCSIHPGMVGLIIVN